MTVRTPDPPCHLVRRAGDKRAVCGVKAPLPVVLVRHARAHGYPHARCRACFNAVGLGSLVTDPPFPDESGYAGMLASPTC